MAGQCRQPHCTQHAGAAVALTVALLANNQLLCRNPEGAITPPASSTGVEPAVLEEPPTHSFLLAPGPFEVTFTNAGLQALLEAAVPLPCSLDLKDHSLMACGPLLKGECLKVHVMPGLRAQGGQQDSF